MAELGTPLYTAAEMRAAEEAYPGYPGTANELMERAGRAVADVVLSDFAECRSVSVVCGGGSNGGDGRIAARLLADAGLLVYVHDDLGDPDVGSPDLVVDAIFGTGFRGAPRADAAALIAAIKIGRAHV